MTAFSIAATILFGILFYKIVNLLKYLRLARATGLPYVITPVLETEVLGFLATPILRYVYLDYLNKGKGWPRWCRFIVKDWPWEDKRLAHEEFGEVFLCVSPEGIICYSADAAMGWDVMNRRNDFTKPRDKYKLLEPYGPNVATAEGDTYRFHVRITAPPFSDLSGANKLVFSETLYQTRRLAEAWAKDPSRHLQTDVNSLTLAVISLAGFGKKVEWMGDTTRDNEVPKGYKMSFLQAISDTTGYMMAILLLPGWLLNLTSLRRAHVAHRQLDKYLREMIRSQRKDIERSSNDHTLLARGNLLRAVLQASASDARSTGDDNAQSPRKQTFTEEEVMGNLFIFLLAGYETTANAIMYGLIMLALREDIQEKVIEEVDAVYAEAAHSGRTDLLYDEDFEKLQYTYGFMYETFRIFPGVILITKMVTEDQRIMTVDSSNTTKYYTLPAGTRVYLNAPAVHYHERYWPQPYKLDPYRWVSTVLPGGQAKPKGTEKKVLAADKTRQMRGTLLTFSDGARTCLGRKFAQAEFIAFFASLLRDYNVELAQGVSRKEVERDLYLKCAGKVTLAPLDHMKLSLRPRKGK